MIDGAQNYLLPQILTANDNQVGWDGIFNGNYVNQGVYVYFAEIEFANGTVETLKGSFTVIY